MTKKDDQKSLDGGHWHSSAIHLLRQQTKVQVVKNGWHVSSILINVHYDKSANSATLTPHSTHSVQSNFHRFQPIPHLHYQEGVSMGVQIISCERWSTSCHQLNSTLEMAIVAYPTY